MPPLAGSVTIPGISVAYSVGDRVSLISGREIDLQTNIGASQGEAFVYPLGRRHLVGFRGRPAIDDPRTQRQTNRHHA